MVLTEEQIHLFDLALAGRQQIPFPIVETLHKIKGADEDLTERIFFEHGGVSAYAAYMFIKLIPNPSHRPGCTKSNITKLLKFVDDLSIEAKRAAAAQLQKGLKQSRTLQRKVEKSHKEAMKRSRLPNTSSNGVKVENSEGDEDSCDPYESYTPTASLPSTPTQQGSGHTLWPPHHGDVSRSQQDVFKLRNQSDSQPLPSSPSTKNNGHTFVNASIIACTQLFPEYLAGAIKQNPNEDGTLGAAVCFRDRLYNNDPMVVLTIEVMPHMTEAIASELFRVRLEIKGGMRYACMGPTKLLATPHFYLFDCCLAPIHNMFGQQLVDVISANPLFQKERQTKKESTGSIWMFIPVAAAECAKINIMLRPEEGMMLEALLFP
jgi:hypothetical protein